MNKIKTIRTRGKKYYNKKKRNKNDELFKVLLETFFYEFVDLFFPEISKLMDKNHLKFMKQEIITDVLDLEKHYVDILVETKLKGENGIVLIHVENQAQRDPEYNRKMFKYFSRLHEKYQKKILPIVIYSHEVQKEEPNSYKIEFSFFKVLEFNFYRMQLNREPWRKYIRSNNPVAAALISKMNYREEEKISMKIEFARMLANMQLDIARNTILTAFFENYVRLNTREEMEYEERIKEELNPEEVKELTKITTSYHKKGEKEGKLEVAQKLLIKGMDVKEIIDITGLSEDEIRKLMKK